MKKTKVALIHDIIAPYRIPIFEKMAAEGEIDFSVFYCAYTHKIRNWEVDTRETYDYTVLPGVCIGIGEISYYVNLSILPELIHGKFDVVIIGGCVDFTTQLAFLFSKLLKNRIILWSEGISSSVSSVGKLASPITNQIISHVDAIVVPGELSRQYHISVGALPDRVFIAPSIVDNDFYVTLSTEYKRKKNELRSQSGIKQNKIILFVGQLIERKGLHFLIEAYRIFKSRYDDACLIIVGDGPLMAELQERCTREHIEDVVFTGWVSEDEKVMYYSIADVFILPTLEDVWGLVVNEAMCCGLPVITTNVAGCSEDLIVPGENGYIINPKNSDEIFQALVNVFKDPSRSELMGRKSLEIIQNGFSVRNTVDGFLSAIDYVREDSYENSDDTI